MHVSLFNEPKLIEYENQLKEIVRNNYVITKETILEVWSNFILNSKKKLIYVQFMV